MKKAPTLTRRGLTPDPEIKRLIERPPAQKPSGRI
jgi:hypothetical protein